MLDSQEKTKWIYLSYSLGTNTPAYGGADGAIQISRDKSMDRGDSCNTSKWMLSNHLGTHIDFPSHFVPHGDTVDNYPINFFIFHKIGFLDLSPVPGGKLISKQDIYSEDLPPIDIDCLIIKTGFCDKRRNETYWKENPGFSPELLQYLRNTFSELKVLGFDAISLSSLKHRDVGRKAHKTILDNPCPILPLEDMDLTQLNKRSLFKQLMIAPWRVRGADATPCTVMAEVYE